MSDAQYIIDIAANMPEGTATIADLDEIAAKLNGAGRRSDEYQAAIKRLTSDLDAAKAASASAAAALASGNEQYQILERDALRAAKAVERSVDQGPMLAAGAARAASAAQDYADVLRRLGAENVTEAEAEHMRKLEIAAERAAKAVDKSAAQQPRLAAEAVRADAALKAYTADLGKLEQASAEASGAQDKVAKSLANVNKIGAHADSRAQLLNQKYEKLAAVVGRVPGPLGLAASQLVNSAKGAHGLTLAFSGAQVALLLGAAAAVIATTALIALSVAFVSSTVGAADTARTAGLAREAFAALSEETAAGVAAFDEVSAATGLVDKDLVALTKQLKAAEVSAADMPEALRAAALAERALGAGGAGEFIERLRAGELAVAGFAEEAKDKFGGIVAKQLRGLDAQAARASALWGKLFDGINIDPFLDAFGVLVGMLDKANPLAQTFGLAITGAIEMIGPMVLSAAYAVEAFALDFAIAAVKVYLFWKKYGDEITAVLTGIGVALLALGVYYAVTNAAAVVALASTAAGWVAAGVAAAAAWVAMLLPAIAVIAAVAAVGYAIGQLIYYWDDVVEGVKLIASDLYQVGVDLMLGLVNGISSTVTAVIDAVKNAVGSAIDAAKSVLGIASPSKVFAEIGTNTVVGFTGAVDSGAAVAQDSLAALVDPTAAFALANGPAGGEGDAPGSLAAIESASAPAVVVSSPAPAAGASSRGASKAFDFAGATFNFTGVKDAESARDMFAEMFTRLLEDDADSLGGAEVPA